MIFYRLLSILLIDKLFFFVTSISIDFWYQSIWIGGLYRLISMKSIDSRYRSGLINSVEQHLMFSDRELCFPLRFYENDGWWSSESHHSSSVFQQCTFSKKMWIDRTRWWREQSSINSAIRIPDARYMWAEFLLLLCEIFLLDIPVFTLLVKPELQ